MIKRLKPDIDDTMASIIPLLDQTRTITERMNDEWERFDSKMEEEMTKRFEEHLLALQNATTQAEREQHIFDATSIATNLKTRSTAMLRVMKAISHPRTSETEEITRLREEFERRSG